jgi:pimeloyl-ACP methyl ester carboxylesterase
MCSVLAAGTFVLLAGCVSLPTAEELREAPSPHLQPGAPAGITDERPRFRQYFCSELEAAAAAGEGVEVCNSWLHRLADENDTAQPEDRDRTSLQMLFVTGAFSECFDESARPFASAIGARAGSEDTFGTIVVGGRSGTVHNAGQIAGFLAAWPVDRERPLVLVGYSKGTSDILQFLVDYPELAARVSAVVSIAGAIGGSPIADRYDGLYDLLFSRFPTKRCEKGDGAVVDDLRTEVRKTWLAKNALPSHVRYYSLAAFTTRERVARALVSTWKSLLRDNRRNDGQLLPEDALLPDSVLLGYLNADHWAVAMELEKEHGVLAARRDESTFPHAALLGAMLRFVGEDLSARSP